MSYLCREVRNHNGSIKVLSIGCGPCSELFPLIKEIESQSPTYRIEYWGIEMSDKWIPFHDEINRLINLYHKPISTNFIIGDAEVEIELLQEVEFDVLILNYFLSDFKKSHHGSMFRVRQLYQLVYDKIISLMPDKSHILINDINHNNTRDCFDALLPIIKRNKIVKKYRFEKPTNVLQSYTPSYVNRGNPPIRIPTNILGDNIALSYYPRTDCSSAQVSIEVR